MADRDRQGENRNRRQEDDSNPIGGILLGLGGLALAGGAVYAATRYFSSDDQEDSRSRQRSAAAASGWTASGSGQRQQRHYESSFTSSRFGTQDESTGTTITIAVDATPTRVGGLLVVPAREEVYFYSIDWSEFLTFGDEPDKFEMVNALLGLSIFDKYVAAYRGRRDEVVLKTDNSFCQNPASVYRRQKNAAWKEFFSKVDAKLKGEPCEGKWQFVTRSHDDYLRIADKLSKKDHSASLGLPLAVLGPDGNEIMGYAPFNISSGHGSLLRRIAQQVPSF